MTPLIALWIYDGRLRQLGANTHSTYLPYLEGSDLSVVQQQWMLPICCMGSWDQSAIWSLAMTGNCLCSSFSGCLSTTASTRVYRLVLLTKKALHATAKTHHQPTPLAACTLCPSKQDLTISCTKEVATSSPGSSWWGVEDTATHIVLTQRLWPIQDVFTLAFS